MEHGLELTFEAAAEVQQPPIPPLKNVVEDPRFQERSFTEQAVILRNYEQVYTDFMTERFGPDATYQDTVRAQTEKFFPGSIESIPSTTAAGFRAVGPSFVERAAGLIGTTGEVVIVGSEDFTPDIIPAIQQTLAKQVVKKGDFQFKGENTIITSLFKELDRNIGKFSMRERRAARKTLADAFTGLEFPEDLPADEARRRISSLAAKIEQSFATSKEVAGAFKGGFAESIGELERGAQLLVEEDVGVRGAQIIAERRGVISPAGLAFSAPRVVSDVALAAGTGTIGAPVYFGLTAVAESARTQKVIDPDRPAGEVLARAIPTGLVSGSLEYIGFGALTNAVRARKALAIMEKVIPPGAQAIVGAALTEGTTEFLQNIVEAVGNNAQAVDEILTVAADAATSQEALESFAQGAIFGGAFRTPGAIREFITRPKSQEIIAKNRDEVENANSDLGKAALEKPRESLTRVTEFVAEEVEKATAPEAVVAPEVVPEAVAEEVPEAITVEGVPEAVIQPEIAPEVQEREEIAEPVEEGELFSLDPNVVEARTEVKPVRKQEDTPTTEEIQPELLKPAPAQRRQVPFNPKKEATTSQVRTKLRDVIKIAEKELNLPIRRGAKKSLIKKALGQFDPQSGVIRTRHANDLQVVAHEIGHSISDRLGLVNDENTNYNQELLDIGNATSGKNFTAAQVVEEGRAEFFRELMLDDATARKLAPTFYDEFHRRLNEDGTMVTAVNKIKAAYKSVINQSPLERIKMGIIRPGDKPGIIERAGEFLRAPLETTKEFRRRTVAQILDRGAPIKNAQEDVYGPKARELNILDDAYKMKANSSGVQGQVNQWLEKGITNKKGETISPAFNKIIDMPLEKYEDSSAYLKSLRIIENLKNGIPQDESQIVAEASVSQYEKKYGLEESLKLRKDVQDWNTSIRQVAVEEGVITQEEADRMGEKGREYFPMSRAYEETNSKMPISATGSVISPFRNQEGDTQDTLDGFGSMQDNALILSKAIRQQKVNRALRTMAQEKDAGKVIEKVDFSTKETQVISVTHEGKRELYHIEDAMLYDALTYSNGSSEVNTGGLIPILKSLISLPATLIRFTAVTNPIFLVKNFLIDAPTAAIQSTSGSVPFVDSVAGLITIFNKKIGESILRDFNISGASQATLRRTEPGFSKDFKSFLKEATGKPGEFVANTFRFYDYIAQAGENAPRVSEFKRVYNNTINSNNTNREEALETAAYEARNLTIDFSRGGTSVKAVNRYIPFFNAGIQGGDRMFRTLFTKRGFLAATTMVFLPELLLWAVNKDDEEYQEQSEFDKDTFFFIPKVGDIEPGDSKFWKLPKPRGYSYFANLGRKGLDRATGRDRTEIDSLVDIIKKEPQEYFLASIPPAFKIPLEMASNHSYFKDRAIVNKFYEGTALENQFHDWTSESAKFIAPKIGMSPIMFDHMVTSLFTRHAQIVNSGINDLLKSGTNTPDKDFNKSLVGNLTGLGNFFASRPTYNAKSIVDIGEAVERLDGLKKDKKIMSKEQFKERTETYSALLKDEALIRSSFRRVKAISKRVRAVYDDEKLSSAEKKSKIDGLYQDMIKAARKGLRKK